MWAGIVSIFPNLIRTVLNEGVVGRAVARGDLGLDIFDPRDYAEDNHRTVDDRPFGGGPGMVMMAGPLSASVSEARRLCPTENPVTVYLSPQGTKFTQSLANELATLPGLVLVAGRYEGVDERVREHLVNREISIGDYVLSGGEIPAIVMVDALVRLIPGAVGDAESLEDDSHTNGLIQFPQYTRPAEYRGFEVPPVLLSGKHQEVQRWRRQQSLRRTLGRRPDLLAKASLSSQDRLLLEETEKSS